LEQFPRDFVGIKGKSTQAILTLHHIKCLIWIAKIKQESTVSIGFGISILAQILGKMFLNSKIRVVQSSIFRNFEYINI
jgi:hypothetical protein